MHYLQSLNIEKEHTVDDITDRVVELEKVLDSLQFTADSRDIDSDDKCKEKK